MPADAMQVASKRRDEYRKTIAKKEAEIAEIKEMIENLDEFIEFGQALIDQPQEAAQPDQVAKRVAVSRPLSQPAPAQAQGAGPSDTEKDQSSIASVLAQRAG